MSTGSGSSSKKRGQYVSRACNECRRRRCKCDGGQPTCGTCTFYDRECTWSTENDARRPATKQLVESLHVKIQALEAELAQLKIRHGIPLTESTSVPPSPLDGTSVLPLETQEPVLPAATHTATVMYRYLFEIDNDIQANEQPNDARLSLVCQWNRYLPQIPQLSRLEHDMILSRFFKYGASWLHCMTPESFLHDMLFCLTSELSAEGHLRLQYYTPFLHCSILAYASALSDNADLRSLHVRAQFAQHARQWLDSEFERPSMSLVHALTLLGEYRSGIGEREAGFMYTGMGFCTARTLVLDLDKESRYSEGASVFSESTDGDWHFWSAFAQDKIMALEYRQEYDIPVPHAGVGLPSIDVESDSLPWSDSETGFSPRLVTKVFFETCKLMVISTKIIDYLHNRDPEAANERVVINTHLQLDTWFNNLPRELLVWARSTSPLPHMIVLHICYWHLIICLHQPLYGRVFADGPSATATTDGASGVDGAGEGGIGQTPIHDLSIKMSDRATHKIVQLLQMYESQHGMASFPGSMIHAIQQCGLALLREAAFVPISATKKRSNALSGATACMRALRGVAASWPWAAHLATDLEGKLRESGVNITMSPFASTIPVPPPNENDPSAMDISQSLYQSIHAWEPMTVDGGATERLQGLGLQAGPSRLGMQASSSTTGAGPSRLGPQSLAPGATVTTNPGMSGGAGSIGSHQGVFDGRAYNMPSFSGTPPGSSTSSYSMGGEGMNEGMWEPPLFE